MYSSESEKWLSVKRPGEAPHDDEIRGSFHLHVSPEECERAWGKISKLTQRKKLGYMSSVSPDEMCGGRWKGERTISIHTLHKDRLKVRAALEKTKLIERAFKYNLIKRFRQDDDDDGSDREDENEESMSEDEEEDVTEDEDESSDEEHFMEGHKR